MSKATESLTTSTPDSAAEREVCGTIPPGLIPDPVRSRCIVPACNGANSPLTRQAEDALWQAGIIAAIEQAPGCADQEDQLGAANDQRDALVAAITASPTRLEAGRHAKAMALLLTLEAEVCIYSGSTIHDLRELGSRCDKLAYSLARDVLAEARS